MSFKVGCLMQRQNHSRLKKKHDFSFAWALMHTKLCGAIAKLSVCNPNRLKVNVWLNAGTPCPSPPQKYETQYRQVMLAYSFTNPKRSLQNRISNSNNFVSFNKC